MKLIEAEKAKDVIHEYFKSLMVNGASGTDVDRLAVGIGSCLKHDANLLKAIDELPSAEQDTTTHDSIPAETGKNDGDGTSGDCISRQAAVDAPVKMVSEGLGWVPVYHINGLPPVKPDDRLAKIAALVEGTIDHFDLDDAMDLLYQIKEVLK